MRNRNHAEHIDIAVSLIRTQQINSVQFESAVSHLDADKADPLITLIQSDTAGAVPCGRDTLDISSKESNYIGRILMRRALCDSPRLDLVSLPAA